jgi:hypothetical protein
MPKLWCVLTDREFTFWNVVARVSECLRRHGYAEEAAEFRTRALQLDVARDGLDVDNEDHRHELLELVCDYVEVV